MLEKANNLQDPKLNIRFLFKQKLTFAGVVQKLLRSPQNIIIITNDYTARNPNKCMSWF